MFWFAPDSPVAIAILATIITVTVALIVREEFRYRAIARRARQRAALLSLLSHQLRSPLTSIRLYSDLLKNGDLGALQIAQAEVLNKLDTELSSAFSVLRSFLQYSGIESQCVICQMLDVDLQNVIQGTIDALHEAIDQRSHTVQFHRSAKSMQVRHDPVLLHGIVQAVLENAIYYTPEEGSISLAIEDSDQGYIINIADTGIGIASNEKKRIFEKFFRGEKAQQLQPNGDGLGLYVTKQLLKSLRGGITFESSEKGTTFSIRIPKIAPGVKTTVEMTRR